MKTFGQVIVAARKAAGLTQKAVAGCLRRADGRNVLPPYLNDLEHDRRYPPENEVIEQLAKILKISADVLYFYARRVPGDVIRDFDERSIEAAFRAFRNILKGRCTTRRSDKTLPRRREWQQKINARITSKNLRLKPGPKPVATRFGGNNLTQSITSSGSPTPHTFEVGLATLLNEPVGLTYRPVSPK